MEIDWITVSAQIVNFLILVWLLKRFLYQPVIRAMEQREQRIASRLTEADQRIQQADDQSRHYQDKADQLEHEREDILNQAREDAEQQKLQILHEAREEIAETRANWRRQVNEEKREFLGNLRLQAAQTIQGLARKALSDLADADLEEQVVHVFIEQLKTLDHNTRKALIDGAAPLCIASTYELDSALRARLTRALHENLAEGLEVDYVHSDDLLCGIELSSGGQRLSWNLADYLEELTTRIEEAFVPIETEKEEA